MTRTKRALLVTPHFAPENHAAVFRMYKLAKYLPEAGWLPTVLTVDHNYMYPEDPDLLAGLPSSTTVETARYIEPTLRGLRTVAKDAPSPNGQATPTASRPRRSQLGARIGAYKRPLVVDRPDRFWTWRRSCQRKAEELAAAGNFDVLMTTSWPYTTLQIGRHLSRSMDIPWVADFRDPLGYSSRMTAPTIGRRKQLAILQAALTDADAVTALSSSYGLIFEDLFGGGLGAKTRFITTGVDMSLAGPVKARVPGHIVFAGEYLKEYGDRFWRILARAIDIDTGSPIKVQVIGRCDVNRRVVGPMLKQYGLEQRVSFIDQLPQRELYPVLQDCHAMILPPGPTSHWWTLFAKVVDAIGLDVPVLALVPDPSESRSRLSAAGLGVFLDGSDEAAAAKLAKFVRGDDTGLRSPSASQIAERQLYTAATQAQRFADVFEEISQ